MIQKAENQRKVGEDKNVVKTLSELLKLPHLERKTLVTGRLNRGNVFLLAGKSNKALNDFQTIILYFYPRIERIYLLKGMAYKLKGQFVNAASS